MEFSTIPDTLKPENSIEEEYMQTLATESITLLTKRSYLEMVKRSIGSKQFRSLYMLIDGNEVDILENGNISCAYFFSATLLIFKLIKEPHATVVGTLRDMLSYGWYEIDSRREGCAITWEDKYFPESGKSRGHIGFYIGDSLAVSNNPHTRVPSVHRYDSYMGRPVKAFYWHPKLDD